jgi:TonB family protein
MAKNESVLNITLEVDFEGEGQGRHEFSSKSVIIGSGSAANLRIDDSSVSSIHAILKAGDDDGTALMSDLGSEEGSRLNGEEIRREATIKRGDHIQLGGVEIFVIGVGSDEVDTKTERPSKKMQADKVEKAQEILEDELEDAQEVEAEEVEQPPPMKKAEPPKVKKGPPKPPPSSKTEVVRRRDIPRTTEIKGRPSGQVFFEREMLKMEQPTQGERYIEVKVMWGQIVLDARQFKDGELISIGDKPNASIRITADRLGGENYALVSPGGKTGCVVNVASGMELDVRKKGKPVEIDSLPSQGAVRTYSLGSGDKCRVMMGQLAFVIQYVSPARGVYAGTMASADYRMGKWFLVFLVMAVGIWTLIQATPKLDIAVADYLKNPARFAQLIMPNPDAQKKKTFEEIKKKKEEKLKVDDSGKWEKAKSKTKAKNTADVPREVKEKMDKKIATNAGILGLLKGKGGGTGDNSSTVFGGSGMANLDASLAGLQSTGMGDSAGFGGLGTRGGGMGGGGGGLGLGGLGTHGYGRGSGKGYGSVKIGHRGKHAVRVVKGRTRVVGGLSQEVVGRYIKRYWAQFKYCYERELSKDPNLYGKITVTFTIAGNGRVSEANVIQTTMHNANVEACVLRVVRRIRFPAPKGGGEVIVTYPFMFTTAG